MSKKKHTRIYTASSECTPLVGNDEVPPAIVRCAGLLIAEASKFGAMKIDLARGKYRTINEFTVNGHRVETGLVGSSYPVLNERHTKLFFQFASFLANQGEYVTQRFERNKGKLAPINLNTHEHNRNAYLVYLAKGAAQYSRAKGTFAPSSFTTGEHILSSDDPSVSFVTSDRVQRTAESVMAAATEIVQNRCIVDRLTLNNGRSSSDHLVTETYQEALANSAGNMLGAIALGWPYRRYENYLANVYDRHATYWVAEMRGRLGINSVEIFAPHLMFGQETYDQLAANELPSAAPELIARQPIPR